MKYVKYFLIFAFVFFVGTNLYNVKALSNGTYIIVSALDNNKVVSKNNDNVTLNTYKGNNDQLWDVIKQSDKYIITNKADGKALALENDSEVNFTNVTLAEKTSDDTQKWIVKETSNNLYNVVSALNNNSFMDVSEAKTFENSNIQIYQNNGNNAQKFKFEKIDLGVSNVEDGYYTIKTKLNNSSLLQSSDLLVGNSTNVNIFSPTLGSNQIWHVKFLENGFYQISSYINDNLLLDVSEAKAKNNTNVQLWQKNGNKAQNWIIHDNLDGTYNIISALNYRYYLDISEAKTINNTNVQIYQNNGNKAQKFIFSKIEFPNIEEGIYAINFKDTDKLVGINSGVAFNNVNVGLYSANDDNGLKWQIKKIQNSIYEVKSALDTKYNLDVSEASKKNNANVQLYETNGNNAQRWRIMKLEDNSYVFNNINSGQNLNNTNNNIDQNQIFNQNQKFNITKTDLSEKEQILKDGKYMFESALNTNKNIRAKSNVVLFDEQISTDEFITTEYVGNGFYTLKVRDKALTNDKDNVILSEYTGSDNQLWYVFKTDDFYTFISKSNGKAIDVSEAKTANNTNIQTWISTGHKAQKFKLVEVDDAKIETGPYNITSLLNEEMYIGIDNEVAVNETNVALYNKNNKNGFKWYFTNIEENIYEINVANNQNQNLDVALANKNNEGNVQIYEKNGNNAQRWRVIKFADGTYRFNNVGSGKNLDVAGAKTANGTNIQQYENNGNNAQKFKLISTQILPYEQILENDTYLFYSELNLNKTIRANANAVLYDVEGTEKEFITTDYIGNGFYNLKVGNNALTNNNGNVVSSEYTGKDNQKWFAFKTGNYYTFISKTDGKVIDVDGAKVANNTNIQTWTSTGHKAQKYRLEAVKPTTLETNYYSIIYGEKALGFNEEVPINGAKVILQTKNNSNQQKWYIKQIKDNLYQIKSVLNPNKVMDVSGGRKDNYTPVQMYGSNNTVAQKWFVITLKDGSLKFISATSHTPFTVVNNNIQIYQNSFSPEQAFNLVQTDDVAFGQTVADNYYMISSVLANGKVLDVAGGLMKNNTNVQLYSNLSLVSQIWKFKYLGNSEYSIISAMNPKKALTNNGNNVVINNYSGSDNQKWYIKMLEDNQVSIISVSNGLYVDVAGAKTANETNIQLYSNNGHKAQKYILSPYGSKKTYHGIDISKYQGNVDWNKISYTNINFVILRVGYGMYEDQKDVNFETYYANANNYNIPVGVYTFSYAGTLSSRTAAQNKAQAINDARAEANVTLKWLNHRHLDLPVFYDLEYKGQVGLGKSLLTQMAEEFCNTIQNNGYRCGIYANLNWLTNNLDYARLASKYPIWLAHYIGPNTYDAAAANSHFAPYSSKYQYWQFASDGHYNGINGNVDMDFGYNIFD